MLKYLSILSNFSEKILAKKAVKRFSFVYPCPRKLREIMQLSLIERESKDKIASL